MHLHDIVRFARNNEVIVEGNVRKFSPVIGEERAILTSTAAFVLAQRPTVVNAFSGTGKTTIADVVVNLVPKSQLMTLDMMSKTAIWYKADEINAAKFLYFPELQNAGDNEEVVKIQKKLGEGKSATRETTGNILSDGVSRGMNSSVIKWHPTLTTMATGNKVGEQVFDEEQQRRCVIVSTDPSSKQTRAVMQAQARMLARGEQSVSTMSDAERFAIRAHVSQCIKAYDTVDEVLVPGLEAFVEHHAPDVFTASRSALPMLSHVIKGVALFYHKDETIITRADGKRVLIVSPVRFAEALDFYGATFFANCMKLPPMGRPVLDAFPEQVIVDGMTDVECMLTEAQLTQRLTHVGITVERKKLQTVVQRLVDPGFLELNEELSEKRWHRTPLASFDAGIKWPAILESAREAAREVLGDDAAAWIKLHAQGRSVTYRSPVTGELVTTGAK